MTYTESNSVKVGCLTDGLVILTIVQDTDQWR